MTPVRPLRLSSLSRALLAAGSLICAVVTAAAQTPDAGLVARGEYLMHAADCMPCHTVRGAASFSGGLAFKLPFGVLYSSNITPDKETGIGDYTDDEFVSALREGVGRGGKHLYPAMPYTSYAKMSREDALAIKAYLFSLAPARSNQPKNKISFPFNIRAGMIGWNLLFHSDKRLAPDASQSAEWNRGAYLVEALGHCGECHTPRGLAQNLQNGQKFAGALENGWNAYNITGDTQSGLGGWSDAALAGYLASGHGEGHSSAAGPMGEVVENSLRFLKPDDIKAMVVYLRTIAPIRNAPAVATAVTQGGPPGSLGERLFAAECANCHDWEGGGAQSPAASLLGSRTVNDPSAANLLGVLIEGAQFHAGVGEVFMPPFARAHSDDEIAALANFVNARFGGGRANVTAADVARARDPQPKPFPQWVIWTGAAVAVVLALLLIWLIARALRPRRRLAAA